MADMSKVNLAQKLASFDETWVPKIVAELNGQYVKVVKFVGEYVWHRHADEDELFWVIKGRVLIHLRDRWVKRLLVNDRVRLNTSMKPGMACGIANVTVDGLDDTALAAWLWNKRKIFTVAIHHEEVQGLRISPSVYTTPEEIDRFCEAVEHAIEHGLPA